MATQVQNRRGTTAEHSTFTGAVGELTVDTDKDTVVVHDGSTAGGAPLLREDQSNLPTSAPSNGVYLPSANNVAISTNGSGALFIDSTGRVLINTATSFGGAATRLQISDSAGPHFALGNPDTAPASTTALGLIRFYTQAGSSWSEGARISARIEGSSGAGDAPTYLTFETAADGAASPTERLRITSDGKLGLGTSNPRSTLNVVGSVGFDSASGSVDIVDGRITYYNAGAVDKFIGLSDDSGTVNAIGFKKTGASTANVWFPSASVGIGIASPGYALDVASSVAQFGNSTDAFIQYKSTAGNWHVGANSSNAYVFYSGTYGTGTERARIDSSGRLLVGTSSALTGGGTQFGKFVLLGNSSGANSSGIVVIGRNAAATSLVAGNSVGEIYFGDTAAAHFASISCAADASTGSGDYPGRLVFSTTADGASSPTERMRISNDGKTTIKGGTSDSSAYSLEVTESGGIVQFTIRNDGIILTGTDTLSPYNNTTASAANLFVTSGGELQRSTSSIKYKRNVEDAVHGLTELLQLRPVTYQSKADSDGDIRYGGLIAEEVDSAGLSEFVQYAENGSPDALAYGNMVSLCIKAIQEQQAVIEELQAKVAALEGV